MQLSLLSISSLTDRRVFLHSPIPFANNYKFWQAISSSASLMPTQANNFQLFAHSLNDSNPYGYATNFLAARQFLEKLKENSGKII
jgi:hypothetical protein